MSMQLITKQELKNNPNMQFGLDESVQNMLTNGNAQFVIDIALEMKLGHSITALSLHIATIFFQRRCYVHHDRFIILTASVLLATKLKDLDSRLRMLCSVFHKIINRQNVLNMGNSLMGNPEADLYTEDKYKRLKEEIMIAESQLLRTLEYNLEFTAPTQYLKKYCDIFYPFPSGQRTQLTPNDNKNRQLNKKLFFGTRVLILDSYRTRACLLFSPLVIFIVCFLIACRYQKTLPHRSQKIKDIYKQRMQKQAQSKISQKSYPKVQQARIQNIEQSKRSKAQRTEKGGQTGEVSQAQSTHLKYTSISIGHQRDQLIQIQTNKVVNQLTQFKQSQHLDKIKEQKKQKDFKLYQLWLQFVSEEEGEKLTAKMVNECLKMVNGLLKLWASPNN